MHLGDGLLRSSPLFVPGAGASKGGSLLFEAPKSHQDAFPTRNADQCACQLGPYGDIPGRKWAAA